MPDNAFVCPVNSRAPRFYGTFIACLAKRCLQEAEDKEDDAESDGAEGWKALKALLDEADEDDEVLKDDEEVPFLLLQKAFCC